MKTIKTDICVIGAGSGGLSVAAGAAMLGRDTVLIERHKMGGDCLNFGCVPSKALLKVGKIAQSARKAAEYGVTVGDVSVDYGQAMAHVEKAIAAIEPNDSVERFEGLGCDVILGSGRFSGKREVTVDTADGPVVVTARRFVISTGSSPMVPPIPGLDETPYLTNESLFEHQRTLPEELVILGGGVIGMEMAQAHQRLGAKVTVIEMFNPMAVEDQEAAAIVVEQLEKEGVTILSGAKAVKTAKTDTGISVTIEQDGETRDVTGSHLLVAVGRKPNIDGLDLEKAGIDYDRRGIKTNDSLVTANDKVFAIGDVAGRQQFTHVAGYHASLVIKQALFRMPAKTDERAIPRVTYTEPELGSVGMSAEQAEKAGHKVKVVKWEFHENDRAIAEGDTAGFVKVITGNKGKIVGAVVVGTNAGEVMQPWVLAIQKGLDIRAMTEAIAPYPTRVEANKRAAGAWYTDSLFSDKTKSIVNLLAKLG